MASQQALRPKRVPKPKGIAASKIKGGGSRGRVKWPDDKVELLLNLITVNKTRGQLDWDKLALKFNEQSGWTTLQSGKQLRRKFHQCKGTKPTTGSSTNNRWFEKAQSAQKARQDMSGIASLDDSAGTHDDVDVDSDADLVDRDTETQQEDGDDADFEPDLHVDADADLDVDVDDVDDGSIDKKHGQASSTTATQPTQQLTQVDMTQQEEQSQILHTGLSVSMRDMMTSSPATSPSARRMQTPTTTTTTFKHKSPQSTTTTSSDDDVRRVRVNAKRKHETNENNNTTTETTAMKQRRTTANIIHNMQHTYTEHVARSEGNNNVLLTMLAEDRRLQAEWRRDEARREEAREAREEMRLHQRDQQYQQTMAQQQTMLLAIMAAVGVRVPCPSPSPSQQ